MIMVNLIRVIDYDYMELQFLQTCGNCQCHIPIRTDTHPPGQKLINTHQYQYYYKLDQYSHKGDSVKPDKNY